MGNLVTILLNKLMPSFDAIRADVEDYRRKKADASIDELANDYGDRIAWKYGSVGAATALPGAIPGLGTATQIAMEFGAISGDLALMLRWMGSMTVGIGMIYDRDMENNFNQDFVKVLGIWCGALHVLKEGATRIGIKVAVAQFKRVPGKIFQKINQRVGTTILTKYGTKRGGVAVGKLVPCGVGALVGGGFNLFTMKTFKKSAIEFYRTEGTTLVMEE